MIFYLIGFLVFISALLFVRHKKNSISEAFLNDLKAEINGTLVKGGVLLDPKLDALFNGKHIVVSSMVSGARAGGSAGRQAIWYAMASLENTQGLSFQLEMKKNNEAGISLKSAYMTGDPDFDALFKIYIKQGSHAALMKIFDDNIRSLFLNIARSYPALRVNLVNNVLDASVPAVLIRQGSELKDIAIFLAELSDKFEKTNFANEI